MIAVNYGGRALFFCDLIYIIENNHLLSSLWANGGGEEGGCACWIHNESNQSGTWHQNKKRLELIISANDVKHAKKINHRFWWSTTTTMSISDVCRVMFLLLFKPSQVLLDTIIMFSITHCANVKWLPTIAANRWIGGVGPVVAAIPPEWCAITFWFPVNIDDGRCGVAKYPHHQCYAHTTKRPRDTPTNQRTNRRLSNYA